LLKRLIDFLKSKGVKFVDHTSILDFHLAAGRVKEVSTTSGAFFFDEVVMALGSWSGIVAKKLNLKLPMQAGKGYSFLLDNVANNVSIPSILLEARVAVTPMGSSLRFGGTMEINGVDHSINMNRVKGIVKSIPHYYPQMKIQFPEKDTIWHGLRPCSPDGLPYIGRSKHLKNLVIATGHSMMGLSLGPATGLLVSEIVENKKSSMDTELFQPDRF
jgi:D-amino-acid dehydrogenase